MASASTARQCAMHAYCAHMQSSVVYGEGEGKHRYSPSASVTHFAGGKESDICHGTLAVGDGKGQGEKTQIMFNRCQSYYPSHRFSIFTFSDGTIEFIVALGATFDFNW